MITEELVKKELEAELVGKPYSSWKCYEAQALMAFLKKNGMEECVENLSYDIDRTTVRFSIRNTHGNRYGYTDLQLITIVVHRTKPKTKHGDYTYASFDVKFGPRYLDYKYEAGDSLETVYKNLLAKAEEIKNENTTEVVRTAEIIKMIMDKYDLNCTEANRMLNVASKLYYRPEVANILDELSKKN